MLANAISGLHMAAKKPSLQNRMLPVALWNTSRKFRYPLPD